MTFLISEWTSTQQMKQRGSERVKSAVYLPRPDEPNQMFLHKSELMHFLTNCCPQNSTSELQFYQILSELVQIEASDEEKRSYDFKSCSSTKEEGS